MWHAVIARRTAWFRWLAIAACALVPSSASSQAAASAFERFTALMAAARYYAMQIDSDEVLGERSEAISYEYLRSPVGARLRVLHGRGTGAKISTVRGSDRVDVRVGFVIPGVSTRMRPHDAPIASLRGNGILEADLNVLLACFTAHRAMLAETRGPLVDRRPTTAIVFEHRGTRCANETSADRDVTADVLYVATDTGVPLIRKRFVGREIVERWRINDFTVETGPRD